MKQENKPKTDLARIGLIAGGTAAGAVLGARTLPRLLRRGRPMQEGESLMGKVVYSNQGVTSPAEIIHIKGKSLLARLRRAAKEPGAKGTAARAALKVDQFIGIPQRHYGVGVGSGRIVEVSKTHGQRVIPQENFGKIRIENEGKVLRSRIEQKHEGRYGTINEAEMNALNERYIKASGDPRWRRTNIKTCSGTNCESYANYIGTGKDVTRQVRAIAGGAIAGGAVGGVGTTLITKKNENMKIKKLSSKEKIILFARGDKSRSILEREGWTGKNADPVKKRLYEAALYKPGYAGTHKYLEGLDRWEGTKGISAEEQNIRNLLKAGQIDEAQAKKDLARYRSRMNKQAAAYRTRAFIKADVDTNVSGVHNKLHSDLAKAAEQGNFDISRAGTKEEQKIIAKTVQEAEEKKLAEARRQAVLSDKQVGKQESTRPEKIGAVERQGKVRIAAQSVEQKTERAIIGTLRRDRDIRRNIARALAPEGKTKGAWRTKELMRQVDKLRPKVEANAAKVSEARIASRFDTYKRALANRAAAAGNATLPRGVGASTADLKAEASRLTAGVKDVTPVGANLPEVERRRRLLLWGRDLSKRGKLASQMKAIERGSSAKSLLESSQDRLRKIPEGKRLAVIKRLQTRIESGKTAANELTDWLKKREATSRLRYDQLSGGERSRKLKELEKLVLKPNLQKGDAQKITKKIEKTRAQVATGQEYVKATTDRILGVRPMASTLGERKGLRSAFETAGRPVWSSGKAPEGVKSVGKPRATLNRIVEATRKQSSTGAIREFPGVLAREGKQLAKNLFGNRYGRAAAIGAGAIGVGTAGVLGYRHIKKKREEEKQLSSRGKIILFAKKKVSFNPLDSAEGYDANEGALNAEAYKRWDQEERERRHSKSRKRMAVDPDSGMRIRKMPEKFQEHVLRAANAHNMPYQRLVGVTRQSAERAGYGEPIRKTRNMLAAKIREQRAFDRSAEGIRIAALEKDVETFRKAADSLNRKKKSWQAGITKITKKHAAQIEALKEAAARDISVARQAQGAIRKAGNRKAIIAAAGGLAAGAVGGAVVGRRKKEEHEFSKKDESKAINPYVMAGASGAASGLALGMLPILKRGSKFGSVLVKTAIPSAAISGGIVGGGSMVGSKIFGEPREDEGSAFTRRAAVGGGIVGAGIGTVAGVALKSKRLGRFKVIQKAQGALKKAARTWKPAYIIHRSGPVVAGGLGGIVGGGYGVLQGADEGQQVDSIRNVRKDLKKMSAKPQRIIQFQEPQINRQAVAKHRYKNQIEDSEWARKERNLTRSALVGGALGLLLRKRLPLKAGSAASFVGGMGAGAGIQGAVNAINPKDEFGDKTVKAKRAEKLPWQAGIAAGAGILGWKGLRKIQSIRKMSSKEKAIQFDIRDLVDTAITGTANAHLTQYRQKKKEEGYLKEIKRSERQATRVRRDYERAKNLIKDAKLKLKGETKYDSRGRERKNEWDKSWVRNAAITAGVAGALLIAKRPIGKIKEEADILWKAGRRGEGFPQLYNSLKSFVKPNTYDLEKSKTFVQRVKGTKLEPLGKIVEAGKKAWREAKEYGTGKITNVAESLDKARTGIPQVRTRARPKNSTKPKNVTDLPFSSRAKIISLSEDVDLIPVNRHIRTRRRTKEELQKERLDQERARHAGEKQLIGGISAATGIGGAALWNRFSPKAREMRRLAEMNAEQIAETRQARIAKEIAILQKHAAALAKRRRRIA